jgi:iron complex outermembrane receptor protein
MFASDSGTLVTPRTRAGRCRIALTLFAALVASAPLARAQSAAPSRNDQTTQTTPPTFQLPPLTVTAQKEPADPQRLPVSVTTVPSATLEEAGVETVSDAGIYAPNTHFSEFTARKLSNPRFRGIGSSPLNPSITTYLDGVPQLNANSSSLDLLLVDQLEFVRGPQSALFGRNALGGVINVTTRRPALGGNWTGSLVVPFASSAERGIRGAASGPIVGERLGAGVSFQYDQRDGFTTNSLTGNDLDSRSAFSGKGQVLWRPAEQFETRVIVSGERDRDGDYALSDVVGLRNNPYVTSRDFEGFTDRDVMGTTVHTRWDQGTLALSTITGFLNWRTEDATDLDYSPLDLATRRNLEESFQFTQEVRLASGANAPITLSDKVSLRWQTGVFFFTQNYDQDASNSFSTTFMSLFVEPLLPPLPFPLPPVVHTSPQSELDDRGVGVYGQGTVTFGDRLDVIAGVRADHERKEAVLNSFMTPALPLPIFPSGSVNEERSFSDVSPQFAVALRLQRDKMVYGSAARGFKAGGFNPSSPPGSEAYEEEHTWNFEGGVKTQWAGGRIAANASVFRIDWDDLQLNLPDPFVPGQFFIDNAGSAKSTGVELEVIGRAREGLDVFGSVGYTRARFDDGVTIGLVNVGGNDIPNTPDFTTTIGAQVTRMVRQGTTIYGRGEVAVHGAFQYDEANTMGQDAYTLTNFRAGVRLGILTVEGWVRNAFDTEYIPIGFVYQFAPSGFIGEMGRPRTFGINAGVSF